MLCNLTVPTAIYTSTFLCTYCKSLWIKESATCPQCKYKYVLGPEEFGRPVSTGQLWGLLPDPLVRQLDVTGVRTVAAVSVGDHGVHTHLLWGHRPDRCT